MAAFFERSVYTVSARASFDHRAAAHNDVVDDVVGVYDDDDALS